MKRALGAIGLALAALSLAACGGTPSEPMNEVPPPGFAGAVLSDEDLTWYWINRSIWDGAMYEDAMEFQAFCDEMASKGGFEERAEFWNEAAQAGDDWGYAEEFALIDACVFVLPTFIGGS